MPQPSSEPPAEPDSRHRILKRLLRFLPRRAVLHKYPLIGRFAGQLRPRHYLWSFRRNHVRRAYYAGSILSFLPLMGIQTPIALVAALLLRSNFMVLGGLQFITNPFTAAPIYYGTHQLGVAVIGQFNQSRITRPVTESEIATLGTFVGEAVAEPLTNTPPPPVHWTKRARSAVVAMFVGGAIVGVCVGGILDLVDSFFRVSGGSRARKKAAPPA